MACIDFALHESMPPVDNLFRRALYRRVRPEEESAVVDCAGGVAPRASAGATLPYIPAAETPTLELLTPTTSVPDSGVRLRSSRPPEGTRYRFLTPPANANDRVLVQDKRLALLVEDDDLVSGAVGAMLEESGWRVIVTSTLEDARRILAAVHPDVLVLDFEIDGEDATGLLDELVWSKRGTSTVLVSACPRAIDAASAYGVELLREPFAADAVTDAVRRIALTRSSVPHRRA